MVDLWPHLLTQIQDHLTATRGRRVPSGPIVLGGLQGLAEGRHDQFWGEQGPKTTWVSSSEPSGAPLLLFTLGTSL